jgi:acetylornithine deacetylase/succinyl-diaminopimelate desuccinylase-like protein
VAGPVDPVELLQRLLRFDTSNPPGETRECARFVAELLADAGLEPVVAARDAARPNVVARLTGAGRAPALLLHAHLDVVPADAREWTYPPFAGELHDGVVWGRGALDVKGGVATILAALLRVRADGEHPPGDVVVALTSDEETGSDLGARFLVDDRPELFAGVRDAVGEGGGFTSWIAGRPFAPIALAEKQRCLIRATVRGAGGHAANVVRGTAAEKAGRLLTTLARRNLPVHVTPLVRTMLRAMSDGLPPRERIALRPVLVPPLTDRVLRLFGRDGDALAPLLHNTATPTVLGGGDATNVVPTELTVDLDGRVLPGQTPDDLVRELERLAPGLATYEVVRAEPAVPPPPDPGLYPLLAAILREHDPGTRPFPALIPGYTDARHFARLGARTYGFLPLRLPPDVPIDLAHAPDERVSADAVRFGVVCLESLIRRYAE